MCNIAQGTRRSRCILTNGRVNHTKANRKDNQKAEGGRAAGNLRSVLTVRSLSLRDAAEPLFEARFAEWRVVATDASGVANAFADARALVVEPQRRFPATGKGRCT